MTSRGASVVGFVACKGGWDARSQTPQDPEALEPLHGFGETLKKQTLNLKS